MERVTFVSTHEGFPTWESTVYITLCFCGFTVKENVEPIIKITVETGGSGNKLIMEITHVTFSIPTRQPNPFG